ncbi:MAG: class II glutamine amidotransferase, partial [Emcibacteraceae bacterium]|nr:class II glutamine amidotransferase [Emcibacteraceae bacterium]
MCGIIGIISNEDVATRIIEGLRRLEYRGYDSAGIATLCQNDTIKRRRAKGKLKNLEASLKTAPLEGHIGIGHTRWATHGEPTVENAHPHTSEKVAVVHNGIIENFRTLRERLSAKGHTFNTETDTETIVHLITDFIDQGMSAKKAAKAALSELEGAFALAIIFDGEENLMIGARRGSPLVLGYGTENTEMYLGSDAIALSHLTNKICYLEEGDSVEITRDSVQVYDENGKETDREI